MKEKKKSNIQFARVNFQVENTNTHAFICTCVAYMCNLKMQQPHCGALWCWSIARIHLAGPAPPDCGVGSTTRAGDLGTRWMWRSRLSVGSDSVVVEGSDGSQLGQVPWWREGAPVPLLALGGSRPPKTLGRTLRVSASLSLRFLRFFETVACRQGWDLRGFQRCDAVEPVLCL